MGASIGGCMWATMYMTRHLGSYIAGYIYVPCMEIIILLLVILIVIAESAAMGCIRMSSDMSGPAESSSKSYVCFTYGVLLYILVAVLLKKSFNIKGMAVVNTLWSAMSVIAVAGVGRVYFGEELTHWEVVAVCLAAISASIMARD